MASLIVNYALGSASVTNPDGSRPASVVGGTSVVGPGPTTLGTFPTARRFGPGVSIKGGLTAAELTSNSFCVRALINVESVTARHNIAECTGVPFSLSVQPATAAETFQLVGHVNNKAVSWSGPATRDRGRLPVGRWMVVDLVYDVDTLALLVDGAVVAVHAYPDGQLQTGTGADLYIGSWVDRARNPFSGAIAAVQVYSGIPEDVEPSVDACRGGPEWQITWKYNSIRSSLNFGAAQGDITADTEADVYYLEYERGRITYAPGFASACEIHGSILNLYKSSATLRATLGPPITDELDAVHPGARKNLFARGGIYWSNTTGAVAVTGRMYATYESLGESGHVIGLPKASAIGVSGGTMQEFVGGRLYLKDGGETAFEVHGAILAQYLATGGPGSWGWPTSDEQPVRRDASELGRSSHFEKATFYWSNGTGAHEVHGAIRGRYDELGGPLGKLGFPTSDESPIPGATGWARYNTFTGGSILFFDGTVHVAGPFQIYVDRISVDDTDGTWDDTDPYLYVRVRRGDQETSRRFPESGYYSGTLEKELDTRLPEVYTPNSPDLSWEVEFEAWDDDGGLNGPRDHLGKTSVTLNMANAWGLRLADQAVFNTGRFGHVKEISWSAQPVIDADTPFDFWVTGNPGTETLSTAQFAQTFWDVDPEWEWWDLFDDLKQIFYECSYRGVASGGNCYGMSLEAIYSWKDRSLLSRPLSRFDKWETVRPEVNIKHGYQIGAEAIAWFLGQFIVGDTHDPVDVFKWTRMAYNLGLNPVICVSQNSDFSGKPHAILPAGQWDDNARPWKISIFDPNGGNQKQTLYVDPDKNEYTYSCAGNSYKGGEWSGGRLHYAPYAVLCRRPTTPVGSLLNLLLGGGMLLVGEGAQTVTMTDLDGANLLGNAATAADASRRKEMFLRIPGTYGDGPLKGELYAHRRVNYNIPSGVTYKRPYDRVLLGRDALASGGYKHTLSGTADGTVDYALRDRLSALKLSLGMKSRGAVEVQCRSSGGAPSTLSLKGLSGARLAAQYQTQFPTRADRLTVAVEDVPHGAEGSLALRVQPGLTALEVISPQASGQMTLVVTGLLAGAEINRRWTVPVAGGTRIVLSEVLATGSVKVGQINDISGPARNMTRLRYRP